MEDMLTARALLLINRDRDNYDITTRAMAETVAKVIMVEGLASGISFLKGVWYVNGASSVERYNAINLIAKTLGLSLVSGDLTV